MVLEAGSTLGHYEVGSSLGAGGMGEVYRAKDTKLGREVAIKLLLDEVASDPERLARFEREARVLASLNHPHIVTIYSVEAEDGVRFFTMELVEGGTLADLLAAGSLPVDLFFEHGVAIADALSAAHRRGVTHRDLKPGNIMLNEQGWLKVLDFGLAKSEAPNRGAEASEASTDTLTGVGRVVGTVPYMSPEQLHGRLVEPPSDIFSLGVVLYEMATGSRPFDGGSQAELVSSILRDTPRKPSEMGSIAPGSVDALVLKCLEKQPVRRYTSATEIYQELLRLQEESRSASTVRSLSGSGEIQAIRQAYRTPMIGRDAEAAELRQFLGRAKEGEGALVSLTGEPGVGKSRLAWDLIERAREEGFFTLVGNCYEGEGMAAFTPWVEVLETSARRADPEVLRELLGDAAPEVARLLPELRRLFPDMPQPLELPAEEARRYLFRSFCEFFARSARLQPLLIVLEDMHWSDEPSLMLLQHLTQQVDQMAVLVIATYREVELDVYRPLAGALRELVRGRLVHRIVLRRLTEEGVAGILASLSGRKPPGALVRAVYEETEGNPFFVEEVYSHLDEERRLFDDSGEWRQNLSLEALDVPEGVRLVVGRRLERLDDEGRKVLTAAAVLGRRFNYPILEQVAGIDADALLDQIERAETLRLVEAESSSSSREARYHFSHELIRQTLLQGLSLPRRQRLHLRIAEVLEARPEPARRASTLAHHLYEAGAAADTEKTARYLILAAGDAIEKAASEEALRHLDLAIDLVEEGEEERWAEIHRLRGLAYRNLGGREEEAVDEWESALEIYLRRQMRREGVEIAHDLAVLYAWSAMTQEAERVVQRTLDALQPDGADRCLLLADAAMATAIAGKVEAAAAHAEEAEALVDLVEDDVIRARVAFDLSWALEARVQEAGPMGTRAAALLEASGLLWEWCSVQHLLALTHCWAGDWAAALAAIDKARPIAEQLGHWEILRGLRDCQEWAEWATMADPERALQRAEADMAISAERKIGYAAYSFHWRSLSHLWMGNLGQALADAEEGAEREVVEQFYYPTNQGLLMLCRAWAGDRDGALSVLERLRDHLSKADGLSSNGSRLFSFYALEALALLGERDEAASLYPALLHSRSLGVRVSTCQLLETLLGISAACGRQWEKAEEHFATALEQADHLPHIPGAAETRRWQAWALLERGEADDRDRARALLEDAIERYREIGMPKHVEMAESLRGRL